MLFNSLEFLGLFIPGALAYVFLRTHSGRLVSQCWLLLLSIAFYSYSAARELPLLTGSVLFNWAMGRVLANNDISMETRGRAAFAAITANIVFLGCFKYLNFAFSFLNPIVGTHFIAPDWVFPLGISFFTLNQIMYLVDCYEGLLPPNTLFDHASFVAFFPYLVAGPLARAKPMIQQFHRADSERIRTQGIAQGIGFFVLGLFKKTVFADSLVRLSDIAYQNPSGASFVDAWVSVLAYTLQIYFDFSGYSDMAIGAAKILGFDIPFNFNAPYQSRSITEFWQRWHISLSNFITTYLYIPILRAFKGKATVGKAAVAGTLAMTVSGLWHGPAWTFVMWGACHGVALAVNQVWRKKLKYRMASLLGWVLTFGFVTLVNVFFRAPNMSVAGQIFTHLFTMHGSHGPFHAQVLEDLNLETLSYLIPALLALPISLLCRPSQAIVAALQPNRRQAFVYASIALYALISMNSIVAQTFVYFAF